MIAGIFHEGSGLGNQLFRYVTTRTLAGDKGYRWGMVDRHLFKGNFFSEISFGEPTLLVERYFPRFEEKKVMDGTVDVRGYDPEINFIQDNTVIDGEFQDFRYWGGNLPEIKKWLAVEPLDVSPDVCVIGFRGGEYYSNSDLGLPKSYFDEAIKKILMIDPEKRFEVHTDDPALAKQFFPDFPIIDNMQLSHSKHSNMGYNWRAMRYARCAIISNSSFYILPRLLSGGTTIAPRYWARRNTMTWALPQNYYRAFKYL